MDNVIERTRSFAPSGLSHRPSLPAAHAAGFILTPLRGWWRTGCPLVPVDIHNFVPTLKH